MDLAVGTAGLADKRNRKIGCELGITGITVKAYRGQVMRKMWAHSFAELALMAARFGVGGQPGHRAMMFCERLRDRQCRRSCSVVVSSVYPDGLAESCNEAYAIP